MRRLASLFGALGAACALAGTVVGSSPGSPPIVPGARGTVWAVERFDGGVNTLSGFDARTGEVLGTVTIGKRPIGVTAPHGTGKVYTADERSNQISVVEKATFQVVKTIPTGGVPADPPGTASSFPHHMMAGPNGRFVYFGRYNTNTVGVVDTSIDQMAHVWPASTHGDFKTHAVWITNDGKDLYATNEGATQTATGTVSKLDTETGTIVWEFDIGTRPSEVLVTPDKKTAYVTVRNDNMVRILDVSGETPRFVGEKVIGVQPDTMQITNDGKTLVVGLRSIPQMALMDTETREVTPVQFDGYGISGHEWLSANGKYTFIALESLATSRPGAIAVVENDSGEILDTWPYLSGPWPHGVFYEPEELQSDDREPSRPVDVNALGSLYLQPAQTAAFPDDTRSR
jgi:YVTN family beta-propeller protein